MMKFLVLASAVIFSAAAAWPQDSQPAFDADAFFSSDGDMGDRADAGSAGDRTEAAGTLGDRADAEEANTGASRRDRASVAGLEARPAGLVFSGEASADVVYKILEPFESSATDYLYAGVTSLRLDAAGGDGNESKIDASAVIRMFNGDVNIMTFELKKLYLSVYTQYADLSAGRMVINYGRGTVLSPVDLFSVVDTADLALGRTGTDAVRVLLPFGDFSGLDLVATLGNAGWDGTAGGRFYGNAAGLDFGLSGFGDGLYDGEGDLVAALDLKGDLELGISFEAVARLPFSAWSPDSSEAVYSVMLGADYSFGGEWFLDAEYLGNLRAGSAYAAGLFRSGHNLFVSVSWKPDELTALDFRYIGVPADGALQSALSLSRNIAAGANLTAYAVYRSGDVEGLYLGSVPPSAAEATSVSFGARLSVAY
jgi:hypothetical protein